MKEIIFNDDNLSEIEVADKVVKVRVIIINSNEEVILSQFSGVYLLPGGKVKDNEDLIIALQREVLEEVGINLESRPVKPLLLIKQYIRDYPKKEDSSKFSDRLNETYYYIVKADDEMDTNKIELTENEIKHDFRTIRIKANEIVTLVSNHMIDNYRNEYYSRELIAVMREFEQNQ